ncbi:MAG TPA: hypothetical protein EYG08_00760 [Myxococcales bacterium]|nr:hypothetical protein [Myxococcales bacterium]
MAWNVPMRIVIIVFVCLLYAASDVSAESLIVRYKANGAYAVEDCAELLWRRGQLFQDATADHSPSLDRWHERQPVRKVRALFRQSNGETLANQALRIERRLGHGVAARQAGAPNMKSSDPIMRRMHSRALKLAHVYQIELEDDADLEAAMASLSEDPHVDFVQYDNDNQLDFDPNDPFLASSGSWSQPYLDLWGLDRIGAREAWEITRGAGQVVAVVDTGLDYDHPDIAENVWVNSGEDLNGNGRVDASDHNGLDDDGNGFVDDIRGYDFFGFGELLPDQSINLGDADPFDENGHGTHVSGIVAATANNGIGISGVAPDAKVMPLKGFGPDGSGRDSVLWRAVLYAVENGADVINASWSCAPACPTNPLAREVLAVAEEAGVVFVTSAGNQAFDVVRNAPENWTAAITVGSIGADDALSFFSSRGWLLDLIAPGGGPAPTPGVAVAHRNILSLAASSLGELEETFILSGRYWRLAGTSMSSPYVAGAIALLRASRPGLSVRDVRRLLRISAEDLPPLGHDPVHGAGVLDLPALLVTELPDLDLEILTPGPGEILRPIDGGGISIRANASGGDLASYTVAFSRGLSTSDFVEIGRGTILDRNEALNWPTESLSDGPYVLRLRATLREGRTVDEYSIVGVERNRPLRLSSGSGDEAQPSISGRNVVWRSVIDRSLNRGEIRAGGFTKKGEALPAVTLSPTSRTQRSPIVSDRRVVWLERDVGSLDDDVTGCRIFRRGHQGCKPRLLVLPGEGGRLSPIRFAQKQVIRSPRADRLVKILGCFWRGSSSCRSREIVTPPVGPTTRLILDFDGRTMLSSSTASQFRLEMCHPVSLKNGALCTPRLVTFANGGSLGVQNASIDGSLLAFEFFQHTGSLLVHCDLDLETAVCRNRRLIETLGRADQLDVSGRLIVWRETIVGEESSIAYCEHDPLSGDCLRQRLVGVPAPAAEPRVDGQRVVWQDARLGPSQIHALELPRIQAPTRIVVRAGTRRFIPVVATDPEGRLLHLELEGVSGPSPRMLGATIVPVGHDKAVIVIDSPEASAGNASDAIWRISGVGRGGLITREVLTIHILPERAHGGDRFGRHLRRRLHQSRTTRGDP